MKVLIIEDNPVDLKLLCAVLQVNGHQIGTCTSAEGALECILADKPDVILLDLNLPGNDGLTLARELRKHAETDKIPIIAITAYPHRYPSRASLAAGCTAHIVKPINTRELVNQVQAVAGGGPP